MNTTSEPHDFGSVIAKFREDIAKGSEQIAQLKDDASRLRDELHRLNRDAATVGGVPNKPKTPIRGFRIPDDVYEAAQAKAKERGETLTDVVRKALERYGKGRR